MRDPRHLRHARAMAVYYRNQASELYDAADVYERRTRLAEADPSAISSGALKVLAWHAPHLRCRALECQVRALFCDDAISRELRDVALAFVAGWVGTLDDLLTAAAAVLA